MNPKSETGTRDEDQIMAKVKAKMLDEARQDMDVLREYLNDLAVDSRAIQPAQADEQEDS